MDVRRFLFDCRDMVKEIRGIERQRAAIRIPGDPVDRTTSIIKADSRTNNPTATALQNLEYYDELLAAKMDTLAIELKKLEDMLGMLWRMRDRTILRYYYGQAWTDEQIAEELDISVPTVYRRRRSAVEFLERKLRL